jgi:hypothetical protein
MKQLFFTASILTGALGFTAVPAADQAPATTTAAGTVQTVTVESLDGAALADDICWVAPEWRED